MARRRRAPRPTPAPGSRLGTLLAFSIRTATRETQLAGTRIPAGGILSLGLGAANHDEARHPDPEAFDILRPARAHLAFGFGSHRCLGMHLARMESRVALEAVLDRLPSLRLDPDAGEVRVTGLTFRSPPALPVLFEAG